MLVAYESLHSMHNKRSGKRGSLALKLDINKAYDRVEWDFHKGIMLKLGLSDMWVDRVMSCVTSSSFSIRWKGLWEHLSLERSPPRRSFISLFISFMCKRVLIFASQSTGGRKASWSVHLQ